MRSKNTDPIWTVAVLVGVTSKIKRAHQLFVPDHGGDTLKAEREEDAEGDPDRGELEVRHLLPLEGRESEGSIILPMKAKTSAWPARLIKSDANDMR